MKMKNKAFAYDDVLLKPQYSDIESRAEIDITTNLGNGLVLRCPILSSPMDTVTGTAMAIAMGNSGGAGIVHRYNTLDAQYNAIRHAADLRDTGSPLGAAIGVTGDYLDRAVAARNAGATFLCVDIAHGHHALMKKAIHQLRDIIGDDMHIMAGNIATLEGINDLADWGADSVRCNIGGGSICSTRIQTGHGVPGLQTILDCAQTDRDVAIIADGGIKNAGDMAKAIAAGADAVMCGSLLAGTCEAPGEIYRDTDGSSWKSYRGMASKEAQTEWRGNYSSLEGVATRVPYQGKVKDILAELERGIRSSFSYSGARSLEEFQAKAEFIVQTSSGLSESHTHILTRQW
jgi:IMP dehydrogenase